MKNKMLFVTNVLIFALGLQLSTLVNSKLSFILGGLCMIVVSTITANRLKKQEEKDNA